MKPKEYYNLLLESANKLSYYYNILKNIEMRGHIDSLEYNNNTYSNLALDKTTEFVLPDWAPSPNSE